MTSIDELRLRTLAWIDADPDPQTRDELESLLAAQDWEELGERMAGTLEFGTAGIRGRVEAGSNRMNRAVVIGTTAGLAGFLRRNRTGPVVVGFDGRKSSRRFASDAIGVLLAADFEVEFFDVPVPTPLVAFWVGSVGAAAGVVITASHNPPADNGYKVYDSNGAQIVPPVDGEIAAAIEGVGPAAGVARVEFDIAAGDHPRATRLDLDEVYERYRRAVATVRVRDRGSALRVVYTPIHGVGWATLSRLAADFGYPGLEVVVEQRDPDGAFPTVDFPNPEEPGAMDLALAAGTRADAELVIANDPDADRLAVALPSGAGHWRMLNGNQIGLLLADWLLEHWESKETPIVISSIVSSPMLGSVARIHGAHFEQTLTGFKWIANAALDLEEAGRGRFVFGYEEALGYSVGSIVRDKDGLSAAITFLDMVAGLAEAGTTVAARMADLYRRAGRWASTQLSVVRPGSAGLAEIEAAMERLGGGVPASLAGTPIARVVDYRKGEEERPRWLPNTSLLGLDLEGGGRVLVRPSGTESKLKIYVDLPGEPEEGDDALRQRADGVAAGMAAFLGF